MSDLIAIVIDNISVRYGRLPAVENVTMHVHAGEIVGLLGPNGSGKSSTLAAIAGLKNLSSGAIRVNGKSRLAEPRAYARQIGFVPQEVALYEELSASANLDFVGSLYSLSRRERRVAAGRVLDQVGLADRAGQLVSTYSGGMRRRLNIACALMHQPSVLLLDEPSVALDVESRDLLFDLLDDCRNEGCAIVLTTHHLHEVKEICDRVGVLQAGRLTALGTPAELFSTAAEMSRAYRISPTLLPFPTPKDLACSAS